MKPLQRIFIVPITALTLSLAVATSAHGQEGKNEATMSSLGKRAVYKHVAAIRAKSDDENLIVVLAARQRITAEMVKSVKEKDAEESMDGKFDMDYVKAVFSEDGKLKRLMAEGNNSSFSTGGGDAKSTATVADGRIRGSLKLVTEGKFGREVTLDFDAQIDAEIKPIDPTKIDPPVKPEVSGKFLGQGKPAELKFVSVAEEADFNNKPAIKLIFTEKDHSAAKKPAFDAAFGKFGSALILSVFHDGGIFGCEVKHTALSKGTFSSIGQIHMEDFELAGGNVKGQVSTGGELEFFGDKWSVDLKFAAPLTEKMRNPAAAKEKTPEKEEPKQVAQKEMEKAVPVKSAGPRISARSLPLPADAADVDFKAIVEQIHCTSKSSVEAVTKDLSARLKAAGWKDGKGGLASKKSAILKREQGDAKLTIMIQPAGTGSTVKIFAEGLDWEGGGDAKPAPKKAAADEDEEDIEKAAGKLLKDALKNIPKGL